MTGPILDTLVKLAARRPFTALGLIVAVDVALALTLAIIRSMKRRPGPARARARARACAGFFWRAVGAGGIATPDPLTP